MKLGTGGSMMQSKQLKTIDEAKGSKFLGTEDLRENGTDYLKLCFECGYLIVYELEPTDYGRS